MNWQFVDTGEKGHVMMVDLDLFIVRIRGDGWPLCPRCGEDELMSGDIPAQATDDLLCLMCHWKGKVQATGVIDTGENPQTATPRDGA